MSGFPMVFPYSRTKLLHQVWLDLSIDEAAELKVLLVQRSTTAQVVLVVNDGRRFFRSRVEYAPRVEYT